MTYDDIKQLAKDKGTSDAIQLQITADTMTGTELYKDKRMIPLFGEAVKVKNMLQRPIGFVCKSTAGRIVRLVQPYNSDIFTAEPEDLPAQWGFQWSKNPEDALPFIALSTSPYNTDEVCSVDEVIYKSTMDNNVWSPIDYPQGWETVMAGEIYNP